MHTEEFINIKENWIMHCMISQPEERNYGDAADIPVIFIHGLGGAADDFSDIWECGCFNGRKLIVPSLIGYGKSSKPAGFSYELEEQAESLYLLMGKLGVAKADVVGHSMGGIAAILFTGRYPEKVGRLIAAEPNLRTEHAKISLKITGCGSEEEFEKCFPDFINRYNREDKPSAYRFFKTLRQTEYFVLYRSALSILKNAKGPAYEKFIGIAGPRWYFKGEKSWLALDDADREAFGRQGIGYHVVPEAGHGMMGDNPGEFYPAVAKRLDTNNGR